jgi:phage shock protein A
VTKAGKKVPTKARQKVPTKARKAKRDRTAKARRRRPPRDERAALLADFARRVTTLGKKRVDELREMYDAAYAEAQVQLERARDRARAQGNDASALRARFHAATEILKAAFTLDAIDESQGIADLQLAVTSALATVTGDDDFFRVQAEIVQELDAWRARARAQDRARAVRLRDLLAAHGFAAPTTRAALEAMLAEAERAVAIAQADEVRLCSSATAERARASEWTEKAQLARNIGEDDLAAQADARVAQYERQAAEWESELRNQTAALEKLEVQLTELRRAVAER